MEIIPQMEEDARIVAEIELGSLSDNELIKEIEKRKKYTTSGMKFIGKNAFPLHME
jgi:hypothetical protein